MNLRNNPRITTLFFLSVLGVLILFALIRLSQSNSAIIQPPFEAEVIQIVKEGQKETPAGSTHFQELEIKFMTGPQTDQVIQFETNPLPAVHQPTYQIGDKLLVSPAGDTYQIVDYVRHDSLLILFGLFLLVSIIIGRSHGVRSLLGLIFSFLIIFKFILPFISTGYSPILVAVGGSILIAVVTFYLSHGVNWSTTVALTGTMSALLITGLIGQYFIELTHLSGFTSDETFFLSLNQGDSINVRGLILAGIIIGALGALDDITISQSAVVREIKGANPNLSDNELFRRGISVGHDHIASLVNTLVLVYTGGALPLLLLFTNNSLEFSQLINYEVIAEEIVRTLVASIGLVLAVPITTFIAVKYAGKMQSADITHHHI